MGKKSESAESANAVVVEAAAEKKPAEPENRSGFYVYLGPWVPGILNHGDTFEGSRDEVLARLADVIKKRPLVRTMLVPGDHLPEALVQLKTQGTALYTNYRRMQKK